MSIQKKILSMTIGPVVLLGLLSIFFMLTTVRSSMMEEIEEGLKGTAAATLAAYDQNTGDSVSYTHLTLPTILLV